MLVRRTVRWLGALLTATVCAAGAAAWHWYGQADGLVKTAVLKELRAVCPRGTVSLESARFDWDRTVTVTGLRIAAPGADPDAAPLAAAPELRITLDRDRFREAEVVEVQALTLVRPTFTLVRRHDGSWDPAGLLPLNLPDPAPAAPRWDVRDATVRLAFHTVPDDPDPLVAALAGVNLTLLPSSRRAYRVVGTATVGGADRGEATGAVKLDGAIDLDRGAWRLDGTVRGLTLGGGLLADAFARDRALQGRLLAAREKWRGLERKLAGERPVPGGPRSGGPVRVASLEPGAPLFADGGHTRDSGPARLTDFGLEGDLSATFALAADRLDAAPTLDAELSCTGGTLSNRFLPFPLSGVTGTVRIAGGGGREPVLDLVEARGRHGETAATASGTFRPGPSGIAGRVELAASRVPITAEMRPRLPDALRKLHVLLDPTGTAEVRSAVLETVVSTEDGVTKPRWELTDLDAAFDRGTARPEKFPYPIRDVRGTAVTDGDGVLRLDFAGTAGGRPGTFTGWVRRPGKRCEFHGEAAVDGFPLDRALRDACPPPVAEALEHMRLAGVADPRLTLDRPAGLDSPVRWTLAGSVRNARVKPTSFPYEVDGLNGVVRFDSDVGRWDFLDLTGAHGPASLAGAAALSSAAGRPRLDLTLAATDVPLDRSLRAALPDGPAAVWDLLRPAGAADARLEIGWSPGRPVMVAAPEFRVRGASVNLTAFPLPLRDVNVRGGYVPGPEPGGGGVRIDAFAAVHRERTPAGEVELRTAGSGTASHRADGEWVLDLTNVRTDGLSFGPALRAAVPAGLRDALDSVNLRGPVDLRVRQLQMRGLADDPGATTAAWDVAANLARNTAELGADVTFEGGRVTCGGRYDGRAIELDGTLRSPAATLLDHSLSNVSAPFRLRGNRLTVGSPPDSKGRRGGARLEANAYGGEVRFDAVADLSRGPAYRLWSDVTGLRLQTYADRHLGGSNGLRGSVKSTLTLDGRGADLASITGTGTVNVEPAALGELPVVMRLFGALGRQDATMFDRAAADFRVKDETLDFRRIDLMGQAISFRGHGWVSRSGRLGLEFFSRPPDRVNIPFLSRMSAGWMRYTVDGSVTEPRVDASSPLVDMPLKALMGPLLIDGGPARTADGRR